MTGDVSSAWYRHRLVGITLAAIALRLLLFFGRGDYVAFDEGWYLLLGRNLWSGDGYTLSGLRHVSLSPLFPVLAGGVDALTGDAVWAGRIVAGLSAGLLVVPCWFLFRRLGGRSTGLVACVFVALLPSLAPFVAPYWIGWDLWVGAEPILHLLLFTGLALFSLAWDRGGKGAAALCGVAFGLAYLARPEAIVVFGLLGLVAVVAALAPSFGRTAPAGRRGTPAPGKRFVPILLCGAAFCVTAAPYWTSLHDALGRWAITGRGIQVSPSARMGSGSSGSAANRIEAMLWEDESTYARTLYSLNAEGTALRNGYWGVRAPEEPRGAEGAGAGVGRVQANDEELDVDGGGTARAGNEELGVDGGGSAPAGNEELGVDGGGSAPADRARGPEAGSQRPVEPTEITMVGWLGRYLHALGVAVPWYVWLFVAAGVAGPWLAPPRRDPNGRAEARSPEPYETVRPDLEALVALPLVATSFLIALLVATDPRTQIFLAPLACFYAARGALLVAGGLQSKIGPEVRPWFARGLVVGSLALVLFATHARRLYLSLSVGSPHHIVAAENAAVGAALDEALPPDATVMSWHPALALFADRDWRVLPLEPMQRIVRYARTQPNPFLVFSVYYPPELLQGEEPHYVVVGVSAETPESERWRIEIAEAGDVLAFGRLMPAGPSAPEDAAPPGG